MSSHGEALEWLHRAHTQGDAHTLKLVPEQGPALTQVKAVPGGTGHLWNQPQPLVTPVAPPAPPTQSWTTPGLTVAPLEPEMGRGEGI